LFTVLTKKIFETESESKGSNSVLLETNATLLLINSFRNGIEVMSYCLKDIDSSLSLSSIDSRENDVSEISEREDDLVVNYDIDVMPKDFRQINGSKIFSKYSLFENPENSLNNIKAELLNIIKVVKPSRIFITNPFLDHHNDHKAMGELLLSMFNDQLLGDADLYFYALHAKKEKDINFGPAGSFISLPYYLYKIDIPDNIQFKYASSVLTEEQLKMKTIMMNNMFDLYFAKDHRWYAHKTIKYFNSKRLGKAYYYHRFAKQNEVFLKIEKTLPNQ